MERNAIINYDNVSGNRTTLQKKKHIVQLTLRFKNKNYNTKSQNPHCVCRLLKWIVYTDVNKFNNKILFDLNKLIKNEDANICVV